MIIFRLKWFSKSKKELDDKLINSVDTFIKEIVKIIWLSKSNLITNKNRYHWSSIAAGILNSMKQDLRIKLFLVTAEDNLQVMKTRYNLTFANRMRGELSAEKYFEHIKEVIRTEKNDSVVKYSDAIDSIPEVSERDLIKACRFIALSLTDQINPEGVKWNSGTLDNIKINWEEEIDKITPEKLLNIISKIKYSK